jgi:3-(3-hydroxy-phenyl)propionate hydroxylase
LAAWVDELEAPVRRECEVTGLAQDAGGVDVALADGRSLRAAYLVTGTRGSWCATRTSRVTREPTLADLSAGMTAVWSTDFGVHDARWISRSTDAARQAASYRERRVLLAGDAAHVHSPVGEQVLNTGVQDAVNLGWKLDATCDGPWELPVLGAVEAPPAVLVRPDGHVAWVGAGDSGHPGLADALGTGSGRRSR